MSKFITRRSLVGGGACALLGAGSVTNTLLNLNLANAAVAADSTQQDDYKALVCIFLHGGNDSYNMLIPASAEEYSVYQRTRENLALDLSAAASPKYKSALKLNGVDKLGRQFAVNSAISELRDIYHSGQLAFLANVGTLVEPTNLDSLHKKQVRLPRSLFSHNSQREQWQTALPQVHENTGWLGRATEALLDTKSISNSTTNISLGGNNLLQTGRYSSAFNISPQGSIRLKNSLAIEMFRELQNVEGNASSANNLLSKVFQEATRSSIDKDEFFSNAFNANDIHTVFPANNPIADSLQAVAKTIAARKSLGNKRQTFFVMAPDWDTHADQLQFHSILLRQLSKAMASFQISLQELGVQNDVTTFTASDFGRTLRSNGRGTDHAWGGNSIVMGGAVAGGKIYGKYPKALLLKDGLDIGDNGRLLPTTSCDQYFAELLRWFGVKPINMEIALPNLGNFYDPYSIKAPLGFMKT